MSAGRFTALSVCKRGGFGFEIDEGPDWAAANALHIRLLDAVDCRPPERPGAQRLLRMLTDLPILSLPDLRVSSDAGVIAEMPSGTLVLEWARGHGWIDRRVIPEKVRPLVEGERAIKTAGADWSAAARVIRSVDPQGGGESPWVRAIEAARAWWLDRLPRAAFAHCADLRRLQPLPLAQLQQCPVDLYPS